MSKRIEKFLVYLLVGAVKQYRRTVTRLVKIEAVTCYVHAVKGARLGFIAWILASLCLCLLVGGFVLIHVALFIYLPWTVKAKAGALLICGAFYFSLALAAILFLTSEKTWMRYAKVRELIDKAVNSP